VDIPLILRPDSTLLHGFVSLRCDPVPNIPKFFVKQVFHTLVQDFYGGAHGSDHSAANNPLCQFQMMKAEEVDSFIKIKQSLRHIVESKEFLMAAVKIVHTQASLVQLSM